MMDNVYLTSDEIYAIENLTEDKLLDFVAFFTPAKKELVTHLFSKNRSLRALEILADERDAHNKRLVQMLKTNGVQVHG